MAVDTANTLNVIVFFKSPGKVSGPVFRLHRRRLNEVWESIQNSAFFTDLFGVGWGGGRGCVMPSLSNMEPNACVFTDAVSCPASFVWH